MIFRKAPDLKYSDVTPKDVYLNRRNFLRAAGLLGAGAALAGGIKELTSPSSKVWAGTKLSGVGKSPFSTTEKQNTYEDVTHYNNFYEFGVDKTEPAKNAQNFKTYPWVV